MSLKEKFTEKYLFPIICTIVVIFCLVGGIWFKYYTAMKFAEAVLNNDTAGIFWWFLFR